MPVLLQRVGEAFALSGWTALAAALGWGVLSVLLSPCHLASVPLVVAYLASGQDLPAPRRAFGIASLFALGILASIAGVGVVTAALGRVIGDVGPGGTWLVAGVLVLFGLDLLGIVRLPGGFTPGEGSRRGATGALVLGLVFGAALGPCTFAFMAPVLALALRLAPRDPLQSAMLVALYALGHAAVIALAGTFGAAAQRWLRWSGSSRAGAVLRRIAGAAVVATGFYLLRE